VGQHADVIPGASVVLHGVNCNHVDGPVAYRREFRVGDLAEFDSFNLSYYGRILAIGAKTVTIETDGLRRGAQRLDLAEFSRRNHDFDAVKAGERNADVMMTL